MKTIVLFGSLPQLSRDIVIGLLAKGHSVTAYGDITVVRTALAGVHFGATGVRFVGAPLWDSDALRAAMRGHGVAMCVGACPKDDDYIRISEAIIAAAIDELSEPSRLWFLSSPAVLELPSHNYIRAAEVPGVATERNSRAVELFHKLKATPMRLRWTLLCPTAVVNDVVPTPPTASTTSNVDAKSEAHCQSYSDDEDGVDAVGAAIDSFDDDNDDDDSGGALQPQYTSTAPPPTSINADLSALTATYESWPIELSFFAKRLPTIALCPVLDAMMADRMRLSSSQAATIMLEMTMFDEVGARADRNRIGVAW